MTRRKNGLQRLITKKHLVVALKKSSSMQGDDDDADDIDDNNYYYYIDNTNEQNQQRQEQQAQEDFSFKIASKNSLASTSASSSSSSTTTNNNVNNNNNNFGTFSTSYIIGLLIGLAFGACIASFAISSNQIAMTMMMQQNLNHCFDDGTPTTMDDIGTMTTTTTSTKTATIMMDSRITAANTKETTKSLTDGNDSDSSIGDMIAYGSQGPASSYLPLKERFEKIFRDGTYDFFYHAFDEDCSADGCIFQKGTSFAEGKNLVVKTIVKSSNYHRYKYVNLFDDDTILWNTHLNRIPPKNHQILDLNNGWKTLHEHLLLNENATIHPIVKPRYWSVDHRDTKNTYQSCTDEQMWIIRRNYLHLFYPFITTVAKDFYWLNAICIYRIMERCYPGGILVYHEWATRNPSHRYQIPTNKASNITWMKQVQKDYLNAKLYELSPWFIPAGERFGFIEQRCTVKHVPTQGIHPECSIVTESKFERWINDEYEP